MDTHIQGVSQKGRVHQRVADRLLELCQLNLGCYIKSTCVLELSLQLVVLYPDHHLRYHIRPSTHSSLDNQQSGSTSRTSTTSSRARSPTRSKSSWWVTLFDLVQVDLLASRGCAASADTKTNTIR